MTLRETLQYIEEVENCDCVLAQVHLKHGIGQEAIPVKWADTKGPNDKPDVAELRRSQLVLSEGGRVLSGLRLRRLLVFRPAVHETWPRTTTARAVSSEVNSNTTDHSARAANEKFEQWMSLVEATEHIRLSQRCNSIEALRQLKREMCDGMVRVRWRGFGTTKGSP